MSPQDMSHESKPAWFQVFAPFLVLCLGPRSPPAGPKFDLATSQSVPRLFPSLSSRLSRTATSALPARRTDMFSLRWGYHYTHSPSRRPTEPAVCLTHRLLALISISSGPGLAATKAIHQRVLCKQVWCLFASESSAAEGLIVPIFQNKHDITGRSCTSTTVINNWEHFVFVFFFKRSRASWRAFLPV